MSATGTLAATLAGVTLAGTGAEAGVTFTLVSPTVSTVKGGPSTVRAERAIGRFNATTIPGSVLKISGVYQTIEGPTVAQITAATEVYLGGHINEVTAAQALALTASGYTTQVGLTT